MVNDATPDIARMPHTFIKRIGRPGQRVGCAIYAEEAVTNAEYRHYNKYATARVNLPKHVIKYPE